VHRVRSGGTLRRQLRDESKQIAAYGIAPEPKISSRHNGATTSVKAMPAIARRLVRSPNMMKAVIATRTDER